MHLVKSKPWSACRNGHASTRGVQTVHGQQTERAVKDVGAALNRTGFGTLPAWQSVSAAATCSCAPLLPCCASVATAACKRDPVPAATDAWCSCCSFAILARLSGGKLLFMTLRMLSLPLRFCSPCAVHSKCSRIARFRSVVCLRVNCKRVRQHVLSAPSCTEDKDHVPEIHCCGLSKQRAWAFTDTATCHQIISGLHMPA